MTVKAYKMKTLLYPLLSCLVWGVLGACSEQVPELYHAPNGIYFNNRTTGNAPIDSLDFTFVYQSDDTETKDVPVIVQSLGKQSDTDRPVNIKVYSENAVEHTDYELLTPAVMPAHVSSFEYVVRLKRTDALRSEEKTLYLELQTNEYFSTFLTQNTMGNGTLSQADILKFRINFSDFYSTAPAGWRTEYVGHFSERKLRLLWKLFDNVIDRSDYNIPGAIPFNKWVYIQREVDKYLTNQLNILLGYVQGTVDPDALVDPDAQGDDRELLDFTPFVSNP
jgi:hypothetical protein